MLASPSMRKKLLPLYYTVNVLMTFRAIRIPNMDGYTAPDSACYNVCSVNTVAVV